MSDRCPSGRRAAQAASPLRSMGPDESCVLTYLEVIAQTNKLVSIFYPPTLTNTPSPKAGFFDTKRLGSDLDFLDF